MGEICKTNTLTKNNNNNQQSSINGQDNNNNNNNNNDGISESPFYNDGGGHKHSGSFVLYLEPILNSYYQSYQNIITVSTMPPGPLSRLVSKIDMPKLSPYQQAAAYASPFYNGCNCVLALMRYPCDGYGGRCSGNGVFKNADAFMGADDIPAVFSYLMNNGYTIDTSISKMMFQSRAMVGGVSDRRLSGDRKMIALISWKL